MTSVSFSNRNIDTVISFHMPCIPMDRVERTSQLDRISPFFGNGNAKVLTGIRRSGKSTLLRMVSEVHSDKNIILFDMELWSNREYRDPDALYRRIKDSLVSDRKNVLLIDEVQDITEWESVIRSLISEGCCDIYLTGSNSRLLSGEFATYLSGRLNTTEIFTLTLSECMRFESVYRDGITTDGALAKFLRFGGFPSIWRFDYNEKEAMSEVRDIVQAILLRDVVNRYGVKQPNILERILRFICDNVGNPISVNNIYNTFLSNGDKVGKDTVYSYLSYLESAYLVYRVETMDLKGKGILKSRYKYYLSDIGIKNALMGYRPDDIPGYMENIIFLELRSRGYDVWIADNKGKEIDFVARDGEGLIYIQATTRLSDEKVITREFGNLRDVDDYRSKYVVVLEKGLLDGDMDGTRCVTLSEFLLMPQL